MHVDGIYIYIFFHSRLTTKHQTLLQDCSSHDNPASWHQFATHFNTACRKKPCTLTPASCKWIPSIQTQAECCWWNVSGRNPCKNGRLQVNKSTGSQLVAGVEWLRTATLLLFNRRGKNPEQNLNHRLQQRTDDKKLILSRLLHTLTTPVHFQSSPDPSSILEFLNICPFNKESRIDICKAS